MRDEKHGPLPGMVMICLCWLLASAVCSADVLQPGFDQFQLATLSQARAWGLAMADFNNDTIPDLVCGETAGDVHFWAGQGDGTFVGGSVVINQVYYNAFGIAAEDFNGDGNQDFILTMRDNYPTTAPHTIYSGEIHLYLGNGDGTFQASGFPQVGLVVGDAGTGSMTAAAGDVDGDGDIDVVAGDLTASDNALADILLFRNQGNDTNGHPTWSAPEVIDQGTDRGFSPVADDPPYYPPKTASSLHAYGLALGDLDGDGDADLLVSDIGSYVYLYRNDGTGAFAPIPYDTISTGTRPYAMMRAHETFTSKLALACGDLNGDGLVDFVAGGDAGAWDGTVDLWLNTGNDGNGWPRFAKAGMIGAAGTDALGLAIGQLNPAEDSFLDVVFGNTEAVGSAIYGLRTDRKDTDGDGIIDLYDNAPLHANAPRLDINDDGGINYLDQLDNDQDGIGDPADEDDDDDGIPDHLDNSPFVYNPDQTDTDGDGRGDVSDPLNNTDSDGDGLFDGPLAPDLYQQAMRAKATWSKSDTHFILRIDALGRQFQNEFTQTFTDGAILTPEEWELNRNFSYNGIGDGPATSGYQVPADLPGGKDTPISLVVISRKIWDAFDDPDPIRWMNARISNPNLEIGQHGSYHTNNVPLGDWADDPTLNYYSCETCGFTLEEMYQYLRVGTRILLGDYNDMWIQQTGADPLTSDFVDWSLAANPLISYAPPYNAFDTVSRDATSRLFMAGFSASVYEENSTKFTPEGSWHEQFDQFGMYHASADLQVDPELHGHATYVDYLDSITQYGGLNTWLIEEVEWSSRYCNDLPRLEYCSVSDAPNRENNMVDPERWAMWMQLLDFVNASGQPMTLGDYALAMAFDNAPTVANPDQADSDHDGIGDVIDGATLTAADVTLTWNGQSAQGTLQATLANNGAGIAGQTVEFAFDSNGDGTAETYTGVTGADGMATVTVQATLEDGTIQPYTASWDGGVMTLADEGEATVPCTLLADLTGDCRVRLDDFAVLASEWMLAGDPGACSLSADLAGGDCAVTLDDLAVLVEEWLE